MEIFRSNFDGASTDSRNNSPLNIQRELKSNLEIYLANADACLQKDDIDGARAMLQELKKFIGTMETNDK
jgi:hypothetical protein